MVRRWKGRQSASVRVDRPQSVGFRRPPPHGLGWLGPCPGADCLRVAMQDANDEFFLATDPSLAKTTGKYFVGQRERRMPSAVFDDAQRRKLWDLLVEQTGCSCP